MRARGWLAQGQGPKVWSDGTYPLLAGPIVTVDTREQTPLTPWTIQEGKRYRLATQRATLATGDYTIAGLEAHVCIERKAPGDLISTLFGSGMNSVGEAAPNQARFREELSRMRAIPFRMLLIEGSRADVWAHRYQSRVKPITVLDLVDALMVDYDIHVEWAGNATEAGRMIGYLLYRIWDQANGGPGARKALARGVAPFLPWCGGAS